MSDHERVQELLAVRALGGLDDEGRAELAGALSEHADCRGCAEMARDFDEAAGRLAFALKPSPTTVTAADVLARADTPIQAVTTRRATVDLARPSPRPRWRSLLVAAAVGLVAIGGVGGTLIARQAGSGSAALARYLTEPETTVRPFKGTGGTLSVATQDGTDRSFVFGNVGAPPPGKVYQLWTVRGSTPVAGPTFLPRGGTVVLQVDAATQGADAVAITVEPTGGSKAPTSTPIFVASLAS